MNKGSCYREVSRLGDSELSSLWLKTLRAHLAQAHRSGRSFATRDPESRRYRSSCTRPSRCHCEPVVVRDARAWLSGQCLSPLVSTSSLSAAVAKKTHVAAGLRP